MPRWWAARGTCSACESIAPCGQWLRCAPHYVPQRCYETHNRLRSPMRGGPPTREKVPTYPKQSTHRAPVRSLHLLRATTELAFAMGEERKAGGKPT